MGPIFRENGWSDSPFNLYPAKGCRISSAPCTGRTEQARALGIFGAPSFVTNGELFWGNDRLEAALDWAARSPE